MRPFYRTEPVVSIITIIIKCLMIEMGKTGSYTPLPNPRQQVCVLWILGDDRYKRIPAVTVGVAR